MTRLADALMVCVLVCIIAAPVLIGFVHRNNRQSQRELNRHRRDLAGWGGQ